jgi:hypothetical protein
MQGPRCRRADFAIGAWTTSGRRPCGPLCDATMVESSCAAPTKRFFGLPQTQVYSVLTRPRAPRAAAAAFRRAPAASVRGPDRAHAPSVSAASITPSFYLIARTDVPVTIGELWEAGSGRAGASVGVRAARSRGGKVGAHGRGAHERTAARRRTSSPCAARKRTRELAPRRTSQAGVEERGEKNEIIGESDGEPQIVVKARFFVLVHPFSHRLSPSQCSSTDERVGLAH